MLNKKINHSCDESQHFNFCCILPGIQKLQIIVSFCRLVFSLPHYFLFFTITVWMHHCPMNACLQCLQMLPDVTECCQCGQWIVECSELFCVVICIAKTQLL